MARTIARALLVAALLASPTIAAAQTTAKAPNLSRTQKQALLAAVTAAREAAPLTSNDHWQMHLLRASDGSHYVAFSMQAPTDLTPDERLVLYVRLEPKPTEPPSTTLPPRSTVEEWLRGERGDPLPMRAARVVTVPSGELPMGGTAATMTRDGSGQNSAVLALMERRQQKAREEAEARERARREALEGKGGAAPNVMPFEDFDMQARVLARPGRPAVFQRALTAGPGDYDVVVAWAVVDGKDRPTRTGALRQAVSLPPVQTMGLALGSVILADAIRARAELYTAEQQTAHPYAIGGTEIDPASDHAFTNDERLSVAFQVFNAAPSATGKPDVGIALRLYRRTGGGEELAASLAPLEYNENTLPADFDLLQGHPLLAAFAAPLRTLPRGEYRLAIAATDRVARTSATAEARFRIAPTAPALLASAPAFTAPFVRARLLDTAVFDPALDALAPHAGSPGLAPLLSLARQHRFVDLMADTQAAEADRGTAILLQSLAAYALGDTPRAIGARLGQARAAGAPEGATQFWLGASLALEGRDADAVQAWQAARAAGWPPTLAAPPIAEAQIRLGQFEEAGRTARGALDAGAVDGSLVRVVAAADIAARRFARAVEVLTSHLAFAPADIDARWMLIHALFASFVAGEPPGETAEGRARLGEAVDRYVAAGGRYRALAEEWRAFVTASASATVP
ncbi:MAG: hypothetical protein AB7Q16_10325 [Vicinamibacterales bacterium]